MFLHFFKLLKNLVSVPSVKCTRYVRGPNTKVKVVLRAVVLIC